MVQALLLPAGILVLFRFTSRTCHVNSFAAHASFDDRASVGLRLFVFSALFLLVPELEHPFGDLGSQREDFFRVANVEVDHVDSVECTRPE